MINEKTFANSPQMLARYEQAAQGLKNSVDKENSIDVLTHASMMLEQDFLDEFDDYVSRSQIELEMALQSLVESCLDHVKNTQGFFMHTSCLLFGTLSDPEKDSLRLLEDKSDLLEALLRASDLQMEAQVLESSSALRQVVQDMQNKKIISSSLNSSRLYILDAESKQTALRNTLFLFLMEGDKVWASCKLSLLIIVALASGHDVAQQFDTHIKPTDI